MKKYYVLSCPTPLCWSLSDTLAGHPTFTGPLGGSLPDNKFYLSVDDDDDGDLEAVELLSDYLFPISFDEIQKRITLEKSRREFEEVYGFDYAHFDSAEIIPASSFLCRLHALVSLAVSVASPRS